MSTVSPFFTVLKHLSAAFSPHSLGMGEDVCVCVFPCPKRSLPRDYPSFCREPLELLTQQLPAEKLCICIDCACLYLCLSPCLSPIPATVNGKLWNVVPQLAFDTVTPFHFFHYSSHSQEIGIYFAFYLVSFRSVKVVHKSFKTPLSPVCVCV